MASPANHALHVTAGLARVRSAAGECERWADERNNSGLDNTRNLRV